MRKYMRQFSKSFIFVQIDAFHSSSNVWLMYHQALSVTRSPKLKNLKCECKILFTYECDPFLERLLGIAASSALLSYALPCCRYDLRLFTKTLPLLMSDWSAACFLSFGIWNFFISSVSRTLTSLSSALPFFSSLSFLLLPLFLS